MARIIENDNFANLNIFEPVLLAVEKAKFIKATDVQKRAIPLANEDENLIVGAPTGSGKTLIFANRAIEVTISGKGLQTLILSPTRELALQLESEIKKFAEFKPLEIEMISGGNSLKSQLSKTAKAEILIATPGRLVEHIKNKTVDLSKIHLLVFDEMDAMLKPEFFEEIELIVSSMPRKRQTLMFSATIDKEVGTFAQKYMKRARRVLVDDRKKKKELEQIFYLVKQDKKLSLLNYLLKNEAAGQSLIFVNRKEVGEFIYKNLKIKGVKFNFVHKDLSQSKREKVLSEFKDEKFDVLIATDIAARGLDVDGITHIYNYTIAKDQDRYIHRIGRTARAGRKGKVIDFISKQDEEIYIKILKERKIKVYEKKIPEDLEDIKIKFKMKSRDYKAEAKKKK